MVDRVVQQYWNKKRRLYVYILNAQCIRVTSSSNIILDATLAEAWETDGSRTLHGVRGKRVDRLNLMVILNRVSHLSRWPIELTREIYEFRYML